jgi:hypothetical protein
MKYGEQEKLGFLTPTGIKLSKVSWDIVYLQSYTTVDSWKQNMAGSKHA